MNIRNFNFYLKSGLCSLFFFFAIPTFAGDTVQLEIKIGKQTREWKLKDLLSSEHLETIQVKNDPTYPHRTLSYKAIPLTDLLKESDFKTNEDLKFICRDGFSGLLKVESLFLSGGQPMIAVEDPLNPWPKLASRNNESAGPFYLIWKNAEKAHVGREQWPFQIVRLEIQPSLSTQFKKGDPSPYLAKKEAGLTESQKNIVQNGYASFTKNCFVCHQFNGEGPSTMGPDLNVPESPTEYLTAEALRKQIRNPQTLKHWENSKMSGFNMTALPDTELDGLIQYLNFMKLHKSEK